MSDFKAKCTKFRNFKKNRNLNWSCSLKYINYAKQTKHSVCNYNAAGVPFIWTVTEVILCAVLNLIAYYSLKYVVIWQAAVMMKCLTHSVHSTKHFYVSIINWDNEKVNVTIDFYNFCTIVSRKKCSTHTWHKCPSQLNNVLTLLSENETSHFIPL